MNGMPWLKHYTNKRNDPRVHVLSLPSKGIYYMLAEVAGQCDAKGSFIINGVQLNDQQIAQLINVDLSDLKKAMREMGKTGLMSANGHGPYLVDFAHEQTSQEERRRQWRERQEKKRDVKGDITQDVTSDKKRDVTRIERESQSQRIESESLLLLLSESDRELVRSKHPAWITEAIALAMKKEKPRATYAAGIIKNWIKEGRNKPNEKNVRRDNGRTKPEQPKAVTTAGDAAAAARIAARLASRKAKSNV